MIKLSDVISQGENQFKFFKGFIGAFRLMHFLPVVTVTTISACVAILTLKGTGTFQELASNIISGTINIIPLIFLILTVFFQEAYCGIHNDYIDHEIDLKYSKRKAITDGWVSISFAFWFGIVCYVLFTGFSIVVGFWSITAFWGVLFVQGANFIGIFYNLYAKHRPISILPYILGFPLIPIYVWITFGGFEMKYLWILPVLILVSLPAHIANELPDYELDVKHERKNFAVFLGKRLSTLIYWLGIVFIEGILLTIFFLYNLNIWILIGTILASISFGLAAFIILWLRKWETDILVFNLVTACIGIEVIGFFALFGI